jgi:hypothetical protein
MILAFCEEGRPVGVPHKGPLHMLLPIGKGVLGFKFSQLLATRHLVINVSTKSPANSFRSLTCALRQEHDDVLPKQVPST